MKVRETTKVEREITLGKACMYDIYDRGGSVLYEFSKLGVNEDGYVPMSMVFRNGVFFAKFRTTEEREMTENELSAYIYVKLHDVYCHSDPARYCSHGSDMCVFKKRGRCVMNEQEYHEQKQILKGKEIIDEPKQKPIIEV